jgi:DNA ligase-1
MLCSYLKEAVTGGAEGLMIKLTGEDVPASNYSEKDSPCTTMKTTRTFGWESGSRSSLWLKLKRDYVAGYADTIDVIPIGAWFGNGRKAQKGFLSPVDYQPSSVSRRHHGKETQPPFRMSSRRLK